MSLSVSFYVFNNSIDIYITVKIYACLIVLECIKGEQLSFIAYLLSIATPQTLTDKFNRIAIDNTLHGKPHKEGQLRYSIL